jgi:phage gp37-like protein
MQQLRCDGRWKALCGAVKGLSRGANDEKDCAIAKRLDRRVAAVWVVDGGGEEGAAMGGLVSRLQFAMLSNA